jgi:hypothetical protein
MPKEKKKKTKTITNDDGEEEEVSSKRSWVRFPAGKFFLTQVLIPQSFHLFFGLARPFPFEKFRHFPSFGDRTQVLLLKGKHGNP